MSANKPIPLYHRPSPPHCPICGQVSYSAAGIHPQCCTRQLDADRMRRLKQRETLAAELAGLAPHSK